MGLLQQEIDPLQGFPVYVINNNQQSHETFKTHTGTKYLALKDKLLDFFQKKKMWKQRTEAITEGHHSMK